MKFILLILTFIFSNFTMANEGPCIELLEEKIIKLKSNNETVFKLNECSEEEINSELVNHLVAMEMSLTLVEFSRESSSFTEIIELLKQTIPDSDAYAELRPITEFWSGSYDIKPAERIEKGIFINNDGKSENQNLLAFFYTEDMHKLIMITKFVESIEHNDSTVE